MKWGNITLWQIAALNIVFTGWIQGQEFAEGEICGGLPRFEAQSVRFESYLTQSRFVGIPEFRHEGNTPRYFRRRFISGNGAPVYDLSGDRLYEDLAPIFRYEKTDDGTLLEAYGWQCDARYDLAGNRSGTLLNRLKTRQFFYREGTVVSGSKGVWQLDPELDVSHQYEWVADPLNKTATLVEVQSRGGETWPNIDPVSEQSIMRDELSEEDTLQDAMENAELRGGSSELMGSENLTFPVHRKGRNVSAQTVRYRASFYLDEPSGEEESGCPLKEDNYPVFAEFESRPVESDASWKSLGPARRVGDIAFRRDTVLPVEVAGFIPVRQGMEIRLKSIWIERDADCGSSSGGKEYRNLGSAQWGMTLDRLDPEGPFVRLEYYAATLESDSFQPQSLLVRHEEQAVDVLREADGTLRQIILPQSVVEVEALDESTFEVRWYSLSSPVVPGESIFDLSSRGEVAHHYRFQKGESGSLEIIKFDPQGVEIARTRFLEDIESGRWTVRVTPGDFIEHLDREESAGHLIETRTTELGLGNPVSRIRRIYHTGTEGGFGVRKLTARIEGQEGFPENSRRVDYAYIEEEASPAFGRRRSMSRSDGYWERYAYDEEGRLMRRVSGYRGNSETTEDMENRVLEWERGTANDLDGDGEPEQVETRIESIRGMEVKRDYTIIYSETSGGLVVESRESLQPGSALDDARNRLTRRVYDTKGRLIEVRRPDGSGERNIHTASGGELVTESHRGGFDQSGGSNIVAGERVVIRTNRSGRMVEQVVTDIASGLITGREFNAETDRDFLGRPLRMDFLDGTFRERIYSCCGLVRERDRRGTVTDYHYDALNRRIGQTRDGVTLLRLQRHAPEFNGGADALVVETMRHGREGESHRMAMEARNLLGEVILREDALGRRTILRRTFPTPGIVEERTEHPDGSVSISHNAADGALLARFGSAEYPMRFEEEVAHVEMNGLGFYARIAREVSPGEVGEAYSWVESVRDMAGQVVEVRRGGVGLNPAVDRYVFNDKGQRIMSVDPDGVTTLEEYDLEGRPVLRAVDMNGNGAVDLDGTDRIIETRSLVVDDPVKGRVRRIETRLAAEAGSSILERISRSDQSLLSLTRWDSRYGVERKTEITLGTNGAWAQIITGADGVRQEEHYQQDRLLHQIILNPAGEIMLDQKYRYDGYNRLIEIDDAFAGSVATDYYADDRIRSVNETDPEGGSPWVTAYLYDERGRERTIRLPDGGQMDMRYTPRGELKKRWGAREYPVEYLYDDRGRRVRMTTWKEWDFSTGEGLNGAATTEWLYDARGNLLEKRYARSANGGYDPGPSYIYSAAGRVLKRHWARGVRTDYSYNAAGDLIRTTYSDATPEIHFSYDRQGRPVRVSDATGLRIIAYDKGTAVTESVVESPYPALAGHTLTRDLDHFNRVAEVRVVSSENSEPAYSAMRSYRHPVTGGETGRLTRIEAQGLTHDYVYAPGSLLIEEITSRGHFGLARRERRTYDIGNRLTGITTRSAGDLHLMFSYTYNRAGQRTRIDREDGAFWTYEYDGLGQVVSGNKFDAGGIPIPGHQVDYRHDAIGNRITATEGAAQTLYGSNALNRVTERNNPRRAEVRGSARPEADVFVNGQSAARSGDYFYNVIDVPPGDEPYALPVKVEARISGEGEGEMDAVALDSAVLLIPPGRQRFTYDADGNLTADGFWEYTWNGENRLVAIERMWVAPGQPRKRLTFAYDAFGRRMAKSVYHREAGGEWELHATHAFHYDDWNLVMELITTAETEIRKTYTWGVDLSGGFQSAGGVGGLLAVQITDLHDPSSSTLALPAFDGNGNVHAYLDAETGQPLAQYEYDPFGRQTLATGRTNFSHRFSTKYHDPESGLLYYGFRYYNPDTGRWLNRDPIEEAGGVNLYGFVLNDPFNLIDILGREPTDTISVGIDASLGLGLQVGGSVDFNVSRTPCSFGTANYSYRGSVDMEVFAGVGVGIRGNVRVARRQFGLNFSLDGPRLTAERSVFVEKDCCGRVSGGGSGELIAIDGRFNPSIGASVGVASFSVSFSGSVKGGVNYEVKASHSEVTARVFGEGSASADYSLSGRLLRASFTRTGSLQDDSMQRDFISRTFSW